MKNWNFFKSVQAVRVLSGMPCENEPSNVVAINGTPIFDLYKALGLFSMDQSLQWAHIFGSYMHSEGIKNGTYIAYEQNLKDLIPKDIVLSKISDVHNPSLDGGLRLIKFNSFCDDTDFFNAISYDQHNNVLFTVEKTSSICGRVLFRS